MNATLIIRRNSDGVTRQMPTEWDGSSFIWAEGNFACDCNRRQFFSQAGGVTLDYDDLGPCGFSGFHVRIEVDGETVYEDGQ